MIVQIERVRIEDEDKDVGLFVGPPHSGYPNEYRLYDAIDDEDPALYITEAMAKALVKVIEGMQTGVMPNGV